MDSVLFERLAKNVCMGLGIGCARCPFNGFREKYDAPSCAEAWRAYQKDAELVLATWIGGAGYVKESAKQEPKKTPETRREILQAAERCVCGGREQVEKVWRAEWIDTNHRTSSCKCTKCGAVQEYETPFCPACGAPMTNEAVQMVMERLEAILG